VPFIFDDGCLTSWEKFKIELISAPIIFALDWTFNDAQLNYTRTEKEFLDVVFALKNFRPYLIETKIIIFTDHFAL